MQLTTRGLAELGVKLGTVSGIVLAILLSGTYVRMEFEIDTRDTASIAEEVELAEAPTAPTLRFD
jgi:hypothetical protein